LDIQRAVDFLVSLFNPEADLLREYRNHPVHFFYNDNYLALPILQQYNRAEVADHIKSTFAYFRKPTTGNGRIEVWHRTRISYPPKNVETQLVHYAGGPVYLTEVTKSSIWQRGDEWKGYADMLLMGVVERWLEKKQYLDLWNSAKAMFNDNMGIVDKPFEKQHVKEDQGPLYENIQTSALASNCANNWRAD